MFSTILNVYIAARSHAKLRHCFQITCKTRFTCNGLQILFLRATLKTYVSICFVKRKIKKGNYSEGDGEDVVVEARVSEESRTPSMELETENEIKEREERK